jgi:hypothetical protein
MMTVNHLDSSKHSPIGLTLGQSQFLFNRADLMLHVLEEGRGWALRWWYLIGVRQGAVYDL